MMIFKVSEEKFMRVFYIHIQQNSKRNVEWYIDPNSILHAYILTDYGYGFYYSSSIANLPDLIRTLIKTQGRIESIL